MSNEVQKINTGLSAWTNSVTDLVSSDYSTNGVEMDEYSKSCAMNAMSSIYQLVTTSGEDISKISMNNLRDVVGQCASLKLNANTIPKEVFFNLRSKKVGDSWVKQVEVGLSVNAYLSMVRHFGVNVDTVYDAWLVKEGDDFIFPKRKGLEIAPPEWEQKGQSLKTIRAVVPIKLKDGTVTYLIAERESVKINLIAHIKQNLLNETFGICKDRYKASDAEKKQIAEKKAEVLDKAKACETLDELLKCDAIRPYISGAWADTPDSMIDTKLVGNAIRKYQKEFDTMASRSLIEVDETYRESQEEVEQNACAEEFVDDALVDANPKEVFGETANA